MAWRRWLRWGLGALAAGALLAVCVRRAPQRPCDVAVRGLRLVAERDASDAQEHEGWQLVARGLGEMIEAEGVWDDPALVERVCELLRTSGIAAGFPGYGWLDTIDMLDHHRPELPEFVEDRLPSWLRYRDTVARTWDPELGYSTNVWQPECQVIRDTAGRVIALLVPFGSQYPYTMPKLPMTYVLVGRGPDGPVAGAWRQYIGRQPGEPKVYGAWYGDVAVSRNGDRLEAAFGGGWETGGTGSSPFPLGGFLDSEEGQWRLVGYCGRPPVAAWHLWDSPPAGYDARFHEGWCALDDMNGDGVMEVVASHAYGKCWTGPHTSASLDRDYYVYKRVGDRIRKVWYAKSEQPRRVVFRFTEAIEFGCEQMALNVCTSPTVVDDARRMGLFRLTGRDFFSPWDLRRCALHRDSGHAVADLGDEAYRFNLVRVGPQSWRISGIKHVGPARGP
ncbi:MAG: hypothetical protein U9R79_10780 [Armatimonadota bacterium]|nr:hypothetical protein [Armatimonadota bacterium]